MSTAAAGAGVADVSVASVSKNKLAKKAKPTEFISHSPYLIEGLSFSSKEFYARVEKALADRKVPDLEMLRVDWKEGGPLSARREYLRLTRERLIFDICAAPFGTGFFVSIWHGEKPLRIGALAWCLLLVSIFSWLSFLARTPFGFYKFMRYDLGLTETKLLWIVVGLMAGAIILTIARAGPNLDNFLIRTPVVGFFYERFFRSITHWRVDRTCMYLAAVHAAVMQVIDEVSKAQGIAPLSEFNRRPPWDDLRERPGSLGQRR